MEIKGIVTTTVLILALITISTTTAAAVSCDCGDICVNTTGWWNDGGAFNASTTPIQAAVNAAGSGDTICVAAGSYTENVGITTPHLTLAGEGADVVTVTAASSSDHVFYVTADYVNISGFNATGATTTGGLPAGIYLIGVDHCNISENTASYNNKGIYLVSSSNDNTLTGNTASNNNKGIYLYSSSNNTLAGNNASNNEVGIYLDNSSDNTLVSNNASNNSNGIYLVFSSNYNMLTSNNVSNNENGIFLISSSDNTLTGNNANSNDKFCIYLMMSSNYNLIYNNYFNNTNNADDGGSNQWNITKTAGTNIIGGPYLGGNYWSDYAGDDTDWDGLGDTMLPYNSSGNITNGGDYHPLVIYTPRPTPPDPENLANTTGGGYSDYWVNYTWSAGTGNVTDSYNVTRNGTWTNGTEATFMNVSMSPCEWANITVFAYNASGTGTLSEGSVSDEVQAPAAPVYNCTCGDICVNETGWWNDGGAFNASPIPIQAAVNAAGSGDTICVAAGSYNENVDIATAHLTLAGAGADVVTVTAANSGDHVFYVTADYVNISGFNATGATSHPGAGIYLNGADHCNISENTASGNWDGIFLYRLSDNTLVSNNVNSNNNKGIYLERSSNNTLAGNNASNNSNGIGLDGSCNYNTLTSNNANSNDGCGIFLMFSCNYNTLAGNNASNNDYYGILLLGSSNNTLTGNNANSNNEVGIGLGGSSNNTLTGNNASNNTQCDICIGSSDSTFTDNTLNGTTISFAYSGDISLKGVGSPAADPTGQQTIGKFINATNQSTGAWLFLNFSYSEADVSGLDESNLVVWKHNGTAWLEDGWNGTRYLDTAGNVVGVNITSFSVFAPAAPDPTYIPPNPVNLANTTGGGYFDYWVNYTWSAGTGNVTDSYNVSLNGAWTNGTTSTFMNVSVNPCEWANITVFAYNASGTGTLSEGSVSDEVQAPCDTTPPDPVNLANTTGGGYSDYWVNYTWSAGTGNATDSYNVNLNGAWTNGTEATFMNVSVNPCEWANITVFAYNASGTGTLSEGSVSDEVQAPCDTTPPVITITTPVPYELYTVDMTLDFSATDESGIATIVGNLTNTSEVSQNVDSGFAPDVGVYTLVVTATDNAGNTNVSDPVFFVVYDPDGGHATGGGWFYTDNESTLPDGKANFGFTAKYKNDVSTGKLHFQYIDAGIKLKSTSIDWLTISSVSAQFQGTGTINGDGLYTFRVKAKDNGEPGVDVDHFDIKIWNGTDTEADPYHKAKNTISGGNIQVHTS